jgi:predicted transcriptional regulator
MEAKSQSQLSIRVEADLHERLERLAREKDHPLSYLVRRVLCAEAARAHTQERA